MQGRAFLFVDGENFRHLVLDRIGVEPANFDFNAFARYLVGRFEIPLGGKR